MSAASNRFSRRLLPGMAALLLGVAALSAFGHSNEYLATIKGDHGGMVRMAEMYHFEVVVADRSMTVWVTDHAGNMISTEGAQASAVLMNKGGKLELRLSPAGGNLLKTEDAKIVADANSRIALTVTMKDQQPLQVRYAPVTDVAADHQRGHAAH